MKNIILTSCLVAAALSAGAAEQLPYYSELGGDSNWSVYDVNNDGKTWVSGTDSNMSATGASHLIKYSWNTAMAADDWYISPAIHLEAGVEYKTKIWYKCSKSYPEKFSLSYATGSSVSDLAAGTQVYSMEIKTDKWTKKAETFTVPETGDYHFGIHCFSDKDKMTVYLTGFEIAEDVFAPAKPGSLTCTPGEDRALTATLSWVLPTTDADGMALPEDASFDAVTVYRDGIQVAQLEGTATTWTDDATAGLTPGYHTYEVSVTINGFSSAKAEVNSKYVGPVEAYTLPYTLDFPNMDQEAFELFWTPVKGRNSTTTENWKFTPSPYYGNRFSFYPGSSKTSDDWLISPQFKFEEAGTYKLTLKMAWNGANTTNVDVLFGEGNTIGGYEQVIGTMTKIPTDATEFTFYVDVDTPGEYGFAIHNNKQESTYSTYYLSAFSVVRSLLTPVHVSDLLATVEGENVNLTWTNPTLTNTGTTLTQLEKVELYRNNELIQSFTETAPGEVMTYLDTPGISGVITYHVLPYGPQGAAEGEAVKVNTAWVGDETQALPYTTSFANNDVTRPIWSGYDANNDGNTWVIGTSAKLGTDIDNDYYRNNDYLLAPYMDLEAGFYELAYSIKGGAKNKVFAVGVVSDKANAPTTFTKLGEIKQTATYNTEYKVVVNVAQGGHFAFALLDNDWVDSRNDNPDEVTKFSAQWLAVVPEPATGLAVVPAADLSLSAEITWTNPTSTNVAGVVPEITKAVISRNGVEIGTVEEGLQPGETASFTDSEVPSAGIYTYSVAIYGAQGCSAKAAPSVASPWIGGGLDLPYVCDNEFTASEWTIHNVNGDIRSEAAGGGPITWEVNSSYMNCTTTSGLPDDWAVSPRLTFIEGHTYEIEVASYTGYSYDPVTWDIHFGLGVNHTDMVKKLATVHTTAQLKKDAQTNVFRIKAETAVPALLSDEEGEAGDANVVNVPAGVGTIGLHANATGSISLCKFAVTDTTYTGVGTLGSESNIAIYGDLMMLGARAEIVSVYDLGGKCVMRVANADTVNLAPLAEGIYVVNARYIDKTSTLKFVK